MGLVEVIITNYLYLLEATAIIITEFLARFLLEGYSSRLRIRKLRIAGIPIAEPYSILTGHLRLLESIKKKLPRDAHHAYIQMYITKNWRQFFPLEQLRCPPVIYLDLWPVAPSLAIVNDPELCAQAVTQLPRSWQSRFTIVPLTRGRDLASSGVDIEQHGLKRARYAPAFSLMNVTRNVAVIVEQASILSGCLRAQIGDNDGCWGGIFSLEDKISAFLFDCLASFTVGLDLSEQKHGHSALRSALYKQTANLLPLNLYALRKRMNPFYHLSIWRNNKAIETILAPAIRSRLYTDIAKSITSYESGNNGRTVLDVIVKRWVSKNGSQTSKVRKAETNAFVDDVLQNVKLFQLAGHDTTTATICFVLEMLAHNPKELGRLREEHNSVLGADYSQTRIKETLQRSPEKLRNLPFTLAVIKEGLRLCPLGTTIRQGNTNFAFNINGKPPWPTDGFDIQTGVWNIHNDSTYWPCAADFVPNRWLVVEKDDTFFPTNRNSWRPFEHGSMSCVGSEFAISVIKIALVFVVREFDLECVWEGMDKSSDGDANRDFLQGERLYRTEFKGGFFKRGMPVHLRRRQS